jgi:putative mRNA 3-end processing factor
MSELLELTAEGLYCRAGDFHVDPWRPVPRAVVTHGHADHARPGMGVVHAAEPGLGLLRWRLGEAQVLQGHPYGEAFTLGNARVSLHPAGHVLGSAQVRIEVDEEVWVISGDYKRDPDPTCAPFEVVPCDVFITEATFGLPVYQWRQTPEIAVEIRHWWEQCAARGEAALLLCYALGKAQRLLAELARLPGGLEREVLLHGAMVAGVAVYRAAGITLPPTRSLSEEARARDLGGALVLAPPSAIGSPWMRRFKAVSVAFASGWMQLRGNRRRRGVDRGFVVSDHADWDSLLRTCRETGARRVLATHGHSEALIRVLGEEGISAAALKTELGGEN